MDIIGNPGFSSRFNLFIAESTGVTVYFLDSVLGSAPDTSFVSTVVSQAAITAFQQVVNIHLNVLCWNFCSDYSLASIFLGQENGSRWQLHEVQ